MAWNIQYLPDQEIILVKNSGKNTYEDFIDRARELATLSEEIQVFRILSDNVEMETEMGTLAIYELPRIYQEVGLSIKNKIAVLISPQDTGIDDFKFYETVCMNTGYRSKIFFRYEDALEWLKQ